ncbi:MAG: hypothetical protein ACE5MM_08815 [Nitrospiraceae bacterium]
MQLVAADPSELVLARKETSEWCLKKIQALRAERTAEKEILAQFEASKWNTKYLKARIRMLERRMVFYGKMLKAVKAGWFIVPNFVTQIFAVRTENTHPIAWGSHYNRDDLEEPVNMLPVGEGEWKASMPKVRHDRDREGNRTYRPWGELQDPDFPLELAMPTVVEQTKQAMAEKLFDAIGIARDQRANSGRQKALVRGDPIIVGILRNPRPNKPDLCFFIAWSLDLESI